MGIGLTTRRNQSDSSDSMIVLSMCRDGIHIHTMELVWWIYVQYIPACIYVHIHIQMQANPCVACYHGNRYTVFHALYITVMHM